MTLYHFCAENAIKSIMRHGINRGYITEICEQGTYIIHGGWRWLTKDPDPGRQSWATMNAIPYTRTAWRLEIHIPHAEANRVYDKAGIIKIYPGCRKLFEGFYGSENWRVFRGSIPKEWIANAMPICNEGGDPCVVGGAAGEKAAYGLRDEGEHTARGRTAPGVQQCR